MYEIIRGPLAWASFTVLIAGSIIQVLRFYRLSRRLPRPAPRYDLKDSHAGPVTIKERAQALRRRLAASFWARHPLFLVLSTLFHILIFMVPLFLMPHNVLMHFLWGVSFCPHTLPPLAADVLTLVIFATLIFFLLRRLLIARVRAISAFGDYLLLALAATPFVTGFLAIHHVFDYRALIISHILSVDLLMVLFPFTKMVHMLFFFINRFSIHHPYQPRSGQRVW